MVPVKGGTAVACFVFITQLLGYCKVDPDEGCSSGLYVSHHAAQWKYVAHQHGLQQPVEFLLGRLISREPQVYS